MRACGTPASNASTWTRAPACASPPIAARNTHASRAELARWPALASPWLSDETRAAATLPARAADCEPDGRDATQSLRIDGLVDRATLARPSNSTAPLRLVGARARQRSAHSLALDGRMVGETRGAAPFDFDFAEHGAHTLTALAETGAWSAIGFRVMESS